MRITQAFTGGRGRKMVFLAHCLLNQNTISDEIAMYPAAFQELVQFFLGHQMGIVQLPYPELCCLGLDRGDRLGTQSPVTEENTRIRTAVQAPTSNRMLEDLVESIMHQVLEYHKYRLRIVVLLGANHPPSCRMETTSDRNQEMPGRGLPFSALEDQTRAAGLETPLLGVKASDDLFSLLARLYPLLQLMFTAHRTPLFTQPSRERERLVMEKRRKQVLAVGFLTGAFAVTAGFVVQGHARAARYRCMLDSTYQYAFTGLAAAVSELDVALRRVVYAASPELLSALCAQAYSRTLAAQSALGELPCGSVELGQAAAFLAKTGDYAMVPTQDAHSGTVCIEVHRETLCGLVGATSILPGTLQSLLAELDASTIQPEDVETARARLSSATESGELLAGSVFQMVGADFPEVPALIYNSPFSDHPPGRTPKMLEGPPQISEAEAHRAAAAFLGLREDIFTLNAQGEGQLPTWDLSTLANSGELYIEVTRQNDQMLQVLSSRPVGEASLSVQEGWQRAAEFLSERSYQDMDPSCSIRRDGILTIHFAPRQDNMYCHPDLVRVGVALDTGDVVSSESGGYLISRGDHTLPTLAVSEAGAAAQVDDSFIVLAHQFALISTGGKYKVLYHESRRQNASGGHALVYVNVADGHQERILLFQEDENGTLVI